MRCIIALDPSAHARHGPSGVPLQVRTKVRGRRESREGYHYSHQREAMIAAAGASTLIRGSLSCHYICAWVGTSVHPAQHNCFHDILAIYPADRTLHFTKDTKALTPQDSRTVHWLSSYTGKHKLNVYCIYLEMNHPQDECTDTLLRSVLYVPVWISQPQQQYHADTASKQCWRPGGSIFKIHRMCCTLTSRRCVVPHAHRPGLWPTAYVTDGATDLDPNRGPERLICCDLFFFPRVLQGNKILDYWLPKCTRLKRSGTDIQDPSTPSTAPIRGCV